MLTLKLTDSIGASSVPATHQIILIQRQRKVPKHCVTMPKSRPGWARWVTSCYGADLRRANVVCGPRSAQLLDINTSTARESTDQIW